MNQVLLAGWIDERPEVADRRATFTVRVARGGSRHESADRTDRIEIVAFEALAALVASQLRPGRPVAVTGRLEERRGRDEQGPWSELRVVAVSIDLLDENGTRPPLRGERPERPERPGERFDRGDRGDRGTRQPRPALLEGDGADLSDADIESVVDEVLAELSPDQRSGLGAAYPMLPAEIDGMLLRVGGTRSGGRLTQPQRRTLRDRFWSRSGQSPNS